MWKPLTNVHLKDTERDVKVTLRWNIQKGDSLLHADVLVWKPLTNVHLEDTERDVKVTLRWNIQ